MGNEDPAPNSQPENTTSTPSLGQPETGTNAENDEHLAAPPELPPPTSIGIPPVPPRIHAGFGLQPKIVEVPSPKRV
jgi:hypothetical protein